MMNIRWTTLIAVVISSVLFFGSSTANAEPVLEEDNFVPIMTVENDIAQLTMNAADGKIYRAEKDTDNWTPTSLKNGKNGFSHLYVFGDTFVVTSFFKVYLSTDGLKWKDHFIYAGEKFNPENIISDEAFYSKGKMNTKEIQEFLESKVDCTNSNCLPLYKEYTNNLNGKELCKDYKGEKWESAARIIYKVAEACKVSAEVLLTILQKEQGLVTSSAPSSRAIDVAMGYGCPDTADCDSNFYGFQNQLWNGAKQLQNYRINHEQFGWFPVGKPSYVPFQVEFRRNNTTGTYTIPTACGGTELTIQNAATSALYYYTPYQPNYAALKNIWSTGDDCSAYGNRNFWRIYTFWFNDTKTYDVYIAKFEKKYVSLDSSGSISISKNLKDWNYNTPINLPQDMRIIGLENVSDKLVANTSDPDVFLVSTDGVNWSKKETPRFEIDSDITLRTMTPHRIEIFSPAKKLEGKMRIYVDGSEYTTIKVGKHNFKDGILKLPSIIFNDGLHTIDLHYHSDKKHMSERLTLTATVGTPKEAIYHTIMPQDTLESIAVQYNNTVEWIVEANGLDITGMLPVGFQLKVKYIYNVNLLNPSPIIQQFHTVMPGQSLKEIAAIHDVSIDFLKEINNLTSSTLYVGQSIRHS